MDYKKKSRLVHGCKKRICMGCAVIEAALRESASMAYRDAANEIESGRGVIDFYTVKKNIMAKAVKLG